MQSKRSLIIGASLGALLNLAATSGAEAKSSDDQSSKEMLKEMQALRNQLDALQRKVDAQAAADQLTKAQADAASAQASAAKASADAAAANVPVEVKSEIAAAKPKTDKIYYKGVTLTLGGYGALESIYRTKSETADMASTFSGIPYPSTSTGHASEFRFSARQSRITALAEGDPTADVHLSFYGELDFLGAAQTANSNETNSYTPRIRVMYNQIGMGGRRPALPRGTELVARHDAGQGNDAARRETSCPPSMHSTSRASPSRVSRACVSSRTSTRPCGSACRWKIRRPRSTRVRTPIRPA